MSKPDALQKLMPNLEQQPAACPSCDGPSIAVRWAPSDAMPESLRAKMDPERPFIVQRCNACIAREDAARVAQVELQKRVDALTGLQVPPLYEHATLENFEVGGVRALADAKAFAARFLRTWPDVPMISLFTGTFGSGKGHIAWAIAKALASTHAVRGKIVVLSDVVRDLRETWGGQKTDGPSEGERLAKYRVADLLVIDEVSRHAFFGQPMQHLYDLVAWREVRLKPTIITTNEAGDELAAVLGPALSSRAIGWGGLVKFGDQDYRVVRREAAQQK